MNFYKPVTLEEYNATLRDSVNAYYTHAMNDPRMSREEAIQSTAEMSEGYLNAVNGFQEAQAAEVGNATDVAMGNEGIDGGVEVGGEGCEGGIGM